MSTWRKVVCCLATVAVAGVSDTAVIRDGKRFSARTSVSELKKWVESLGV